MNKTDYQVVGFCSYCKDAVYSWDDYKMDGKDVIHSDCKIQKENYYDPLDFGEEDEVEESRNGI